MTPKLSEIARRIDAHLKRFERDPKINGVPKFMLKPYYNAGAHRSGCYVHVTYVSYQGGSRLDRARAEAYLAWLDSGNVGTHWDQRLKDNDLSAAKPAREEAGHGQN